MDIDLGVIPDSGLARPHQRGAPAQSAALDVELLANHGSIAYYANNNGDDFTAPIVASFASYARWQGLLLYSVGPEVRAAAAADLWPPPIVYAGAVVLLGVAAIVAFILVWRASPAFERRADATA